MNLTKYLNSFNYVIFPWRFYILGIAFQILNEIGDKMIFQLKNTVMSF